MLMPARCLKLMWFQGGNCDIDGRLTCRQTPPSTGTKHYHFNCNYLIHTIFACLTSAPHVNCTMYNPEGKAPASITAL